MAEQTLKEVIDELSLSKAAYKFARIGDGVSLAVEGRKVYWRVTRPLFDGSRGVSVSFC